LKGEIYRSFVQSVIVYWRKTWPMNFGGYTEIEEDGEDVMIGYIYVYVWCDTKRH